MGASTTILTIAGTYVSVLTLQKPAQAASRCECVQYVRNRFGLPSPSGNANQWNDGYLQRNRFRQVGPTRGSIVVFEKTFPGADSRNGHVAVLEDFDPKTGKITVRGANQGGNSIENNCSNVNSIRFGTSINGRSDVSFWQR